MKKNVFLLLVIGAVLMTGSPAGAKWLPISKSKTGSWFVSDRVIKVEGDCKTVLVGLIYKKPIRAQGRMVLAKKYVIRVCCRANTYQSLGFILVDTNKKDFFKRKVSSTAKQIKPKMVVAGIAKRVCAPGFGGKAPDKKGSKTAPAADTYKRTCKLCSNSGGIWLCCTCLTRKGANKRSCIDPRKCRGKGISNCDGKLTCGPCQ